MSKTKFDSVIALGLVIFVSIACSKFGTHDEANKVFIPAANTNTSKTPIVNKEDASTSGGERQKPAAGKGNVQGKVLFNDQPVEGIEVRVCENLSTIMGIKCDGKSKTVKTGADGVFVVADLDPMTYGGLTAKVFKSNYYLYPYDGYTSLTPKSFKVEADKTIFASDINLFKDDLKITQPKAGAKVDAKNLELKWNPYPDATYYKLTLFADGGGAPPINDERVEDAMYSVAEPLTNGKYRIKLVAYNANDRKLAETGDDIKFNVTGGAEPTPTTTP